MSSPVARTARRWPSYVELSTCLDMDKSVTELKKADRTLDSGMDLSSNTATDPYTVLRQQGEQ